MIFQIFVWLGDVLFVLSPEPEGILPFIFLGFMPQHEYTDDINIIIHEVIPCVGAHTGLTPFGCAN